MMRLLLYVILPALSVTAHGAVYLQDPRVPLALKGPEAPFNLTAAEIARLRNVVGYVYCPGGRDPKNAYGTSGFLIGTATDQYVVTVAHAFINEKSFFREPLSACTFTSFGLRSEKIPLVFNTRAGTYLPLTFNWATDSANDVMIVRLSRPSPDAEPFRLNERPTTLAGLGEKNLFVLSALQEGVDFGADLILQNCATRKFFDSNPKRPSIAYTDCAARVGASGSLMFTRLNGQLTPVGLIQGSSLGPDGLPYDEASRNYTFAIGFDGRFIEQLSSFMGASF